MFIWGTIFSYYICEIKIKFVWQVFLGWLFQPGNGRPRNFLFKTKINKIRRHRLHYRVFLLSHLRACGRVRVTGNLYIFIFFNFCWNGNKRDEIIADFSYGRRSVVYENQSEEIISEQLPMATLKQLESSWSVRKLDSSEALVSIRRKMNSDFRHKLNGGRSTFVTLRFLVKCNRE